ncbi:hypothetical protein SynBIOSE41_02658 [Synechococcus sp. BIOS-E4-1]|nr:hypothetical protein SynBIOSE41_02658 [Synechococcus sp. BIOS-E4-1]
MAEERVGIHAVAINGLRQLSAIERQRPGRSIHITADQ